MYNSRFLFSVLLIFLSIFCQAAPTISPHKLSFCVDQSVSDYRDTISLSQTCSGPGEAKLKIPYFRNKPLNTTYPQVKQAIVTIHGIGSDADTLFTTISSDVKQLSHRRQNEILLVSPQFLRDEQISDAEILQWPDNTSQTWSIGESSSAPNSADASSMDILDLLLKKILNKAPNLKDIFILGHSAGAQFVQRYAAGNQKDGSDEYHGITFHYGVANPLTYMYLDNTRFASDGTLAPRTLNLNSEIILGYFEEPSTDSPTSCNGTLGDFIGYNDYPFGIENINDQHYMADVSNETLMNNMKERRVLFLSGALDKEPVRASRGDCEHFAQGTSRFDRSINYIHHLRRISGTRNKAHCIVSGVGHNGEKMYQSFAARQFWQNFVFDCSYFSDEISKERL